MRISQHILQFGPHTLSAEGGAQAATPYFLAGRRMYSIGQIDGAIQPIGAEHLVGEMGGVWAHPVKIADGLTFTLAEAAGNRLAAQHVAVIAALSHIEWRYQFAGLELRRRDFVAQEHAALVSLVSVQNTGTAPRAGALVLAAWLKFLGCWFGGLAGGGGEFWLEGTQVRGYDSRWQGRWGLACGSTVAPARCDLEAQAAGCLATLAYAFELGPGATTSWEFLLTADHERGHAGAQQLFGRLAGTGGQLLAETIARYQHAAFSGVALSTPDPAVDRAFALAKANLELLSAEYGPYLPAYFLAGVPEYPQLFGCDTEYSVPGATAAGFAATSKSALLALADYGRRACGRIPHEVTTNGRVFHPGNTQETPQFAIACWDYFRWTGDEAFLRLTYPLCQEGVDAYMPAMWGPHGGAYPIGDGVVERQGMGSRKLDSTCYLFGALRALGAMAEALALPHEAAQYMARAAELRQHFEQDWWIAAEGMYADSLHTDLRPQLDGHWTVVLPLQLGLAADARARQSLDRIEREWLNEWGLVHTRTAEERVWTLPTGLLALTAFRYGRPELGLRLLLNIAETTRHGMLGVFKELIPIGLCFVQLWSAGLYLQGMIEGLLGLQPLAHRHRLVIEPQLPAGWPSVQLSELAVGVHTLTLRIAHDGIELQHQAGPAPLDLRYRLPAGITLAGAGELCSDGAGAWLQVAVPPAHRLCVYLAGQRAEAQLLGLAPS